LRHKLLAGLAFSSCVGFFSWRSLALLIYALFRRNRPGTLRRAFGRLQLLSAEFMAFSHSSDDGSKFIGIFTLALVLSGPLGRGERDRDGRPPISRPVTGGNLVRLHT